MFPYINLSIYICFLFLKISFSLAPSLPCFKNDILYYINFCVSMMHVSSLVSIFSVRSHKLKAASFQNKMYLGGYIQYSNIVYLYIQTQI